MGGSRRRWRRQQWCRCSGVPGSNGKMGNHHGDEEERKRGKERGKEREKKKNEKETRGWPAQDGRRRCRGGHR